jgi:sodium-dependent phosphate cotransporter
LFCLGILIWFPIPIMRNVPIRLAKKLGETTAKYRWFAIVYIIASFFLIPLIIFLISLAGWYYKKFYFNLKQNFFL